MIGQSRKKGFSLIELSIVLVIIGLIVGGIVVGQSLVLGAEVRSQITQIEKLRTSINAFRGKYEGLPGDLQSTLATQFGFNVSADGCDGHAQGFRDGNGNVEGSPGTNNYQAQGLGETIFFWADLSVANLIENNFSYTSVTRPKCGTGMDIPQTALDKYFPSAKLGRGNYLYVSYMTQTDVGNLIGWGNYMGIAAISSVRSTNISQISSATVPVSIAYAIDNKMDDGVPLQGSVTVGHLSNGAGLLNFATWELSSNSTGSTTTSCYTIDYSTTPSRSYYNTLASGSTNCALAFKF